MPTTEIVNMPLLAGSELGNPDNDAAVVFKDCSNIIRQNDGFQQLRFSTWVESADTLQLLINWDSKQNHEDFKASNAYGPFLNRFKTIMSAPAAIAHIDFEPAAMLRTVTAAPVTEILTVYFDGAVPDEYVANVDRLIDIVREVADTGIHGLVRGATHEHDVKGKGKKGQAMVVMIGWQSVEAHTAFSESSTFRDNIHLLRHEAGAMEMHHVALMEFVDA